MINYLDRSIKMLGKEKIESFKNKVILVAGIGGVGGTALEALARSGFDTFILIDFDNVDVSNLNRQILYTSEDIGMHKVNAAKKRILSINSSAKVEVIDAKIISGFFDNVTEKVDFIVDAIDYVPGKLELYKFALNNNIPFISSLGMGNRINPSKVKITKLNKTEGDPLARKIRYECKNNRFDLSKINVVFSNEVPLIKSDKPGSMMMVPSAAGLLIAQYVIENIGGDL